MVSFWQAKKRHAIEMLNAYGALERAMTDEERAAINALISDVEAREPVKAEFTEE